MKTRPITYLAIPIITMLMLLVPLVVSAAPPGTIVKGDYIDVSKQTWIEYPEPITDPLGHPERPWQPKEEFPFKQPYTGVELQYLSYGGEHNGLVAGHYWKVDDRISARLNKRGLLVQRVGGVAAKTIFDSYKDAYLYDSDKDGKVDTHDIWAKMLNVYMTPAEVRGSSNVMCFRINSPKDRWVMDDIWAYSPGLRRVTRVQGGDRQDEFAGTSITYDDIAARQIWEEEHLLIGEDVIYELLMDPQILAPHRKYNAGDFKKDGEWIAKNLEGWRGEEEGMSPYRPDGGIECWVVLSRWVKRTEDPPYGSHVFPDPKGYYLKYRISWIDKVTKLRIWSEQYDHGNRLIKWDMIGPYELTPGGFKNGGGWTILHQSGYDLRRHFSNWTRYYISYSGKEADAPDDWFTPEHMFREYFWGTTTLKPLKSGKEFPPPMPCGALSSLNTAKGPKTG